MLKNKKGWIRIIEAFVAILLITGVLLIAIQRDYIGSRDLSLEVKQAQLSVLREIELDDGMRAQILGINESEISPEDDDVEWEEFNETEIGIENIKTKIETRMPDYLECKAKICMLEELCVLNEDVGKDIYAQSVAIAANNDIYSPRQLKMFCWTKG